MVEVRVDDVPGDMVVPVLASTLVERLGAGAAIEAATSRTQPVTSLAGTCGNCGHIIGRTDNYCSECGRMIERNG